jgi:hypothetical protein
VVPDGGSTGEPSQEWLDDCPRRFTVALSMVPQSSSRLCAPLLSHVLAGDGFALVGASAVPRLIDLELAYLSAARSASFTANRQDIDPPEHRSFFTRVYQEETPCVARRVSQPA